MKWISLALIVIPATCFGVLGKPTEMGMAILAGTLASSFLNLDKFTKIKGGGFEAELQEAVNEAYATIDNLKEVAEILCSRALTELTYGDRIGGSNVSLKVEQKNKIVDLINKMEIENKEFIDILDVFNRFHIWDLYGHIISELFKIDDTENLRKELNALYQRDTDNYPSREKILSVFDDYEIEVSENIKLIMEDYICFIKYGELKR